jgi:hypothetical protein
MHRDEVAFGDWAETLTAQNIEDQRIVHDCAPLSCIIRILDYLQIIEPFRLVQRKVSCPAISIHPATNVCEG